MKISSVSIVGFAGVAERLDVDLRAEVVILVGANGHGKTTICDSVAWALTGQYRGGVSPRNLYSGSGTTSVELEIRGAQGNFVVSRSLANPSESDSKKFDWRLIVRRGKDVLEREAAEAWLAEQLAPNEPAKAHGAALQMVANATYLRQESLREFLTGNEDTERFEVVARLVGAGRLQEFVTQLESAKTAWARAVNDEERSLQVESDELSELKARRRRLEIEIEGATSGDAELRRREWTSQAEAVVGEIRSSAIESDAARFEALRRLLGEHVSRVSRRVQELAAFEAELNVPAPVGTTASEWAALEIELEEARELRRVERVRVNEFRSSLEAVELELSEATTSRVELATLANIALRHLGESCVACGQPVVLDDFRSRLESMVERSESRGALEGLAELRQKLGKEEIDLAQTEREVRRLEDLHRSFKEDDAAALVTFNRRLARAVELSPINGHSLPPEIEDLSWVLRHVATELAGLELELTGLEDLEARAVEFELVASLDSARKRVADLDVSIDSAQAAIDDQHHEIDQKRTTGEIADVLCRRLRDDAEGFVGERLQALQPLLNQLYAAIDPHPTFRDIGLVTRQAYGKRRLDAQLRDVEQNVVASDPGYTLSTSQANALAVAIFLAFNLGLSTGALETLILDDPLQNLDDVHLLGLVDLLRKVAPQRQIIVATHDNAFAHLLRRKLRPVGDSGSTSVVRFTKWDRRGPGVETLEVPYDKQAIRLVSQ